MLTKQLNVKTEFTKYFLVRYYNLFIEHVNIILISGYIGFQPMVMNKIIEWWELISDPPHTSGELGTTRLSLRIANVRNTCLKKNVFIYLTTH